MGKDERLEAALANWAPRFVVNGVDFNVFRSITDSLERWEQWCERWSAAAGVHEKLAEQALDREDTVTAAHQLRQAAVTYHFAKFLFMKDTATMQETHAKAVRLYTRALPLFEMPGERVEISYGSEVLPAILRKPPEISRPAVVVLVPGLDSAKEEFYELENSFLLRGMATLSVDGPGIGESEYRLPIEPHWEKPMGAVLDWLEKRVDLDRERAGSVGVSMGGYYVTRAIAFEKRLRAAIELAGPYNLAQAWEGLPVLTREAFQVRSRAVSEADAYRKACALDLTGVAEQIKAPLLVVHGKQDRIFPPQHAQRIYDGAAGPKSLWILEEGNHVCNNVTYQWRLQMGAWMGKALAVVPQ